jgi:hypothetical protein
MRQRTDERLDGFWNYFDAPNVTPTCIADHRTNPSARIADPATEEPLQRGPSTEILSE